MPLKTCKLRQKGKIKMKKFISLLLIAIMVFSLAACNPNSPQKALGNMLDALKAGDLDKLGELNGEKEAEELTDEDKALFKAIYGKMDYKVGKAEIDGDKAKVELELTVVDLSAIMEAFVSEAMEHMLDSDWDYEACINELVSDKDAKTKSFELTVPMEKSDGKWIVDEDGDLTDFISALTGGISA